MGKNEDRSAAWARLARAIVAHAKANMTDYASTWHELVEARAEWERVKND